MTDWHQGVIGILSFSMKDKCHRRVIGVCPSRWEWTKGSARSIPRSYFGNAFRFIGQALSATAEQVWAVNLLIMAARYVVKNLIMKQFRWRLMRSIMRGVNAWALEGDAYDRWAVGGRRLLVWSFAEQVRLSGLGGRFFAEAIALMVYLIILQQRIVDEKSI